MMNTSWIILPSRMVTYSDKEWRAFHPMVKRKKFLSRADKSKKGGASEVRIDDMQLLKSVHEHDKLLSVGDETVILCLRHRLKHVNPLEMT